MAIKPDAVMIFTSYTVEDAGIRFHFVCADPGPGLESDYFVFCTDAEVQACTTQPQLKALLTEKLDRAIRYGDFGAKLDPLLGQSITI
jgi:hypothetical protein